MKKLKNESLQTKIDFAKINKKNNIPNKKANFFDNIKK